MPEKGNGLNHFDSMPESKAPLNDYKYSMLETRLNKLDTYNQYILEDLKEIRANLRRISFIGYISNTLIFGILVKLLANF